MAEKITIDGKSYRRFIAPPGPVRDGTHRCIQCGQIDDEPYHDHDVCVQVATGDYKGAKLKMALRADSGFSSSIEAMVSVNQWRKINAVLNEAQPGTSPLNDEGTA